MEFLVTISVLLVCALVCEAQHYNYYGGSFGSAPVGEDGRVVDTPEVARAKAAHMAAFKLASRPSYYHSAPNHQISGLAASPLAYGHHGSYSNPSFFSTSVQHGIYGYRGPPAPLDHEGRVVDTPEVAQAKAAHFAAFNHAASRAYDDYGSHYPSSSYRGDAGDEDDDGGSSSISSSSSGSVEAHASSHYQGPQAPLAQDGRVVDTPEVAHAKAAHLAALHRASHGRRASYFTDY